MLEQRIQEFLEIARRLEPAKARATFTYLAVRCGGEMVLVQSRLFLGTLEVPRPPSFSSQNVTAGQYLLSELDMTPEHLISSLTKGRLQTPQHEFVFPKDEQLGYGCTFDPFHAALQRTRVGLLVLTGQHRHAFVNEAALNWELRASETPFESLAELFAQYPMGSSGAGITFEAVAPPIIDVDSTNKLHGTQATIGVALSPDFQREKASIGYRLVTNKGVERRGRFHGNELEWRYDGDVQRGSIRLTVPIGSIIECFAAYDGIADASYYFADPANHMNSRRTAYEQFDKNVDNLRKMLMGETKKAPDLEAAVSWLFWMLGFGAAWLGNVPLVTDAPDLIATARSGDFAVVECTTGPLKADKLAKLVQRANEVRERLQQSGSGGVRVLPVIVTCLPLSAVEAQLAPAKQHGVYVLTRERLEIALQRTDLIPDPARFFEEAIEEVTAAKSQPSVS